MRDPSPSRTSLEELVARTLDLARHRAGLTQEEMVKALSPYQSRPAQHQQRWHDWIRRPSSVSSLALVAAARMGKVSLDELLAEDGGDLATTDSARDDRVDQLAARLEGLEGQLATFIDVMTRLQESVEVQGQLLKQVVDRGPSRKDQLADVAEEPTR